MKKFRKTELRYILMLLPAMLILVGLIVYPLIFSLGKSFTDYNLGMPGQRFVGLTNFINAIKNANFRNSLLVSVKYSVAAVCLEFMLGLGAALLLQRRFPGVGILTLLMMLPMMVTPVAVGIIWLLMFQPDFSVINGLLTHLGITGPIWLQKPTTALFAIVIADVWQWTPFFFTVLLAGLLSLPTEMMEAAEVDGATGWQKFWFLTLPLLKPLILVVALIRLIDSLKDFDKVYVMTNGGPGNSTELLSLYIYRTGLPFMDIGSASAMSYLFLILLTVATMFLITRLRSAD